MQLKGKKITFLGDSITEGVGTSAPEYRFVDIIARETGAVTVNHGISGTRLARQYMPTVDNPRFDLNFCDRAKQLDKDSDIIVVFGGTNDFGHGDAPFGEFTDRTYDTYCGAVHQLCNTLLTMYTEAEIVFIAPLHRLGEDNPNASNHRPLKDYIDILRKTCEYYSIPVLDLYAGGKMQPAVKAIQDKYMPDGLHPSDAGNRILADRIKAFLENM